jgi:hypothetical protein
MEEAIKLAGMFIDSAHFSHDDKQLTHINDPYKGMLFKDL